MALEVADTPSAEGSSIIYAGLKPAVNAIAWDLLMLSLMAAGFAAYCWLVLQGGAS